MKKYFDTLSSPRSFSYIFLIIILMLLILPFFSFGQYSLASTSYSQNFDGLGTNASNTVAGGDLSLINTSLNGWYFYETGSAANTTITTGTGSSATGDTYNYGLTGNSNRSLGSLLSGALVPTYGFYFTNNTGSTITSLTISFTGEVWREGATGRNDEIDFYYSSNATSLSTGTWTAASSLNYVDNTSASTASGSLLQSAPISATLSGLSIVNGTSMFIKWVDVDASGADDGISIDNFSFSASNTGASPTISLGTQHPAGATIYSGSSNNIIAIYSMVATNATINPTQAVFTTGGSYASPADISGFTVYQNTAPTLGGATTVFSTSAVSSGSNITVSSGFSSIATGTTSYFIITANVGGNPTTGHIVNIASTALSNFSFSGIPVVTGTNPLTAGNNFTISTGKFTPDNLAALVIGDGSSTLNGNAAQIQIWQYSTSTAQSPLNTPGANIVIMPTTVGSGSSGNRALTQSGSATSEGFLNLSGDGRYLSCVGYNAATGASGVASGTAERVVGLVDANGNINTSTTFSSGGIYSGNNIRSSFTPDGTGFWTAGPGAASGGIRYIPVNSTANTTAVQLNTLNSRGIAVFNSQLYVSSNTTTSPYYNLSTVGSGTPTSASQTVTSLANFPLSPTYTLSPYGYVFFDRSTSIPGVDLLYVTCSGAGTTGGLYKFYKDASGNWQPAGSTSLSTTNLANAAINTSYSYFGITGTVNCNNQIDLYVTYSTSANAKSTNIAKLTDAASYSATPSYTTKQLATAPTKYEFGGISFTPMPDLTISSAYSISAGTYRNITINSGGIATLGGDITVLGTVTVNNGGVLDCSTYHILSTPDFQSFFSLQPGGTVKTAEYNGLFQTPASYPSYNALDPEYSGAVQTCGTRYYDPAANYEYESTGSQFTGNGVPSIVNNLTLDNTSNLSLTNSMEITSALTIAGTAATNANLNLNGNTLTLDGTITNSGYGTLTGSTSSNMVIQGSGSLNGNLVFAGGSADVLNNFTLNRNSQTALLGSDLSINNIAKLTAGAFGINGYSLTLGGTLDNTVGNTGTISGDASAAGTSKLSITGSGNLGANLTFTSGAQVLQDFTLNRSTGLVALGSNLSVGGTTSNTNYGYATMTSGALTLNGYTLGLNGYVTGSGTFSGSNTSSMTIGGNLIDQLGTINFTSGSQVLNSITMNRFAGASIIGNAVLGTNLTASNIILTNGVIATGNNLFTWDNTGSLTAPGPNTSAGESGAGNVYDSYIATCDNTGTPVTGGASATSAYTGNVGFKIQNVTNTNTYFPVGQSYNTSTTGQLPTPNRVMINNQSGSAADYTVLVNEGDIGYTPGNVGAYRVNRVWYVKTNAANDGGKANMQLFFFKRDNAAANWSWPAAGVEDEVEAGFDYSNMALVEKDYSGDPNNFTLLSKVFTSDIINLANNILYPYNSTEAYSQYTIGTSTANDGSTNGVGTFNRFSIVNPSGIILPIKVVNFTAYQQGSGVQTGWTCLNEINMDHYELQRSADAVNFSTIGSVAALDNGQPSDNYGYFDKMPLQGNNFYRVKAIGKDGSITYTSVAIVVIGGGNSNINIFPNPVTNHNFVVQMVNIPAGKYQLEVYNSSGQLLLNNEIDHSGGSASQTVYLPAGAAKGEYHVKLSGAVINLSKTITVE